MKIPYESIDENMRNLVRAFNRLPGIRTIGCCGGHENPSSIQHSKNQWFVSFKVNKDGNKSLKCIVELAHEMNCHLEQIHSKFKALIGRDLDPNLVASELLKRLAQGNI